MNVAKTQAAVTQVRHERAHTVRNPNVNQVRQKQQKQPPPQAVEETKKTTAPKAEKMQKGGEINITA